MFSKVQLAHFFDFGTPERDFRALRERLVAELVMAAAATLFPLCAKAEKEYAKRIELYLQLNEVFGRSPEVSGLDFSLGAQCSGTTF
ncbi:MAG: hypothetical protein ABR976_15500 [Terracidiphilus sp.]|jgi:hypothetical protein